MLYVTTRVNIYISSVYTKDYYPVIPPKFFMWKWTNVRDGGCSTRAAPTVKGLEEWVLSLQNICPHLPLPSLPPCEVATVNTILEAKSTNI